MPTLMAPAAPPVVDAIVPVGGLGTRLLPATRSQPKEMLPVVDKPVVQYVVEELIASGISRMLLVTGRRKRAIEDHFDAAPELGLPPLIDPRRGTQILYTRQVEPAGLGDAIRYGAALAQDRGAVVALGDTIIENRGGPARGLINRMIDAFTAGDVSAVLAVEEVALEATERYGIVSGSQDQSGLVQVEAIVEKPPAEQAPARLAVAARYVIGPAVFEALRDTPPDARGEVQVADALTRVLDRGGRVLAVPLAPGERRHDIGTVEGYCSVFLHYALQDPRLAARLHEQLALQPDDVASDLA